MLNADGTIRRIIVPNGEANFVTVLGWPDGTPETRSHDSLTALQEYLSNLKRAYDETGRNWPIPAIP